MNIEKGGLLGDYLKKKICIEKEKVKFFALSSHR